MEIGDTAPKSITNHKFSHAAVAAIVCWIQDAVLLMRSKGETAKHATMQPPFSDLNMNENEIAEEWKDIQI